MFLRRPDLVDVKAGDFGQVKTADIRVRKSGTLETGIFHIDRRRFEQNGNQVGIPKILHSRA
jgi:hypothetical protein